MTSTALTTAIALTAKQLAFATLYMECGNATRAYRETYDCEGSTSQVTRCRAFELRHHPAVARHIAALKAAVAEDTVVSVRARMVHLQQIVDADPDELTSVVTDSCRHCHGIDGRYQWAHEQELVQAVERYTASLATPKPLRPPDPLGGFDFDPTRPPREGCAHCAGRGIARVVVTPTNQLSPAARTLFKGARQKADGSIEIFTHDKMQAADQLNRLQGAYLDRSVSVSATVHADASDFASPDALLAAFNSMGGSK